MYPFLLMANRHPYVVAVTSGEGNGGSAPSLDVSGLQLSENDVLVVFFAYGEAGDESFGMSGFTLVADLYQAETYNVNLHVGYKVQTSTPDTSVTVGPSTGDTSDPWAAVAFNVRGVDTSNVLDVSATTATANNTGLINPPSISPVTNKSLVLSGGATASNDSGKVFSSSELENFTNREGNPGAGATNCFLAVGSLTAGVSTFNPSAFTSNQGDSTSSGYCACTLALRPR